MPDYDLCYSNALFEVIKRKHLIVATTKIKLINIMYKSRSHYANSALKFKSFFLGFWN